MSSKPPLAGIHGGSAPTATIPNTFFDDILDGSYSSCCSTPYASAPSSPGHRSNNISYFYSAPTSPMHFLNSTASGNKKPISNTNSFEFDFSGPLTPGALISSADELFLNGQIRPMKLSSHLQRPQNLAPLIDLDEEDEEETEPELVDQSSKFSRGRDLMKLRESSLRRRARSLSPLRTEFCDDDDDEEEEENRIVEKVEQRQKIDGARGGTKFGLEPPSLSSPASASSSRSSSSNRNNSNRWIFLKDFIRSKSDGSGTATRRPRFWSSISFSNNSKSSSKPTEDRSSNTQKGKLRDEFSQTGGRRRLKNGVGKRPSAHEVHYTAKRAQAEEMRRKTFLPYRQGLLGCLGFSSKGYGAMDGFARAFNSSVSSR